MNKQDITTLGQLKKTDYKSRSVKDELRANLIAQLQKGEGGFEGIVGFEDTVIPDLQTAILSRHNILLLGLRGQAKTRIARLMVNLLDEYMPYIEGSELYDDPLNPISWFGHHEVLTKGDDTPIAWVHRSERYTENLATPDVTVADLIGDVDPIKAATMKLTYSDERVIHFGLIPRAHRGIFVINELPDLQARIQVSLFNILQERDIQIRGFKLRLPLDLQFVFTANPEDYTNRGSIVTPLKDRIESQILTHYPKTIETALAITEQEADVHADQKGRVIVSDLVKRLIEQVSFEARTSEYVDKKSGVSARLTIAAFENAVSAAERRAILNNEKETQVWMSDLVGIVPSITGKIELVYEGEQEGPYQVAFNLLEKSFRTLFVNYFPNPDQLKKRKADTRDENPFKAITHWFDKGNHLNLFFNTPDSEKIQQLYKVDGLHALVKKHFKNANEREAALLMEFVLHGLAAYSLISKKVVEGKIEFKDLIGSMVNLGSTGGSYSGE